jgi:hypothetical protein
VQLRQAKLVGAVIKMVLALGTSMPVSMMVEPQHIEALGHIVLHHAFQFASASGHGRR